MFLTQLFEIEQTLARQGVQSQLEAAKKELKDLAKQCSMAFKAAGMMENQHPQVRKALDLCSLHSPSHKPTQQHATSSIADLWKDDAGPEAHTMPVDKKELATSILGKSLVDTLVEENREPPDVSMHVTVIVATCTCPGKFPALWCPGKFPALWSPGKFPALWSPGKFPALWSPGKFPALWCPGKFPALWCPGKFPALWSPGKFPALWSPGKFPALWCPGKFTCSTESRKISCTLVFRKISCTLVSRKIYLLYRVPENFLHFRVP